MKKIYGIIVFLCLFLGACESDKDRGLRELSALCEKDAGLKIYKTVTADGYADTFRKGIVDNLVKSDYRYIEFCELEPISTSLFQKPGCWRLEKVDRNLGECSERADEILFKRSGKVYRNLFDSLCIKSQEIPTYSARYSYNSDFNILSDQNEYFQFGRTNLYTKDEVNNELLGEFVSYFYTEKKGVSSSISCYQLSNIYPYSGEVLEKTIKNMEVKNDQ